MKVEAGRVVHVGYDLGLGEKTLGLGRLSNGLVPGVLDRVLNVLEVSSVLLAQGGFPLGVIV